MTTTLSSTGLALLAAALLLRALYVRWLRADGVYVVQGDRSCLRWNTRSGLHEVPWSPPRAPGLPHGSVVTVYYHSRHPDRWSPVAPYRRHIWALSAVGAVLLGAGTFMPLLMG